MYKKCGFHNSQINCKNKAEFEVKEIYQTRAGVCYDEFVLNVCENHLPRKPGTLDLWNDSRDHVITKLLQNHKPEKMKRIPCQSDFCGKKAVWNLTSTPELPFEGNLCGKHLAEFFDLDLDTLSHDVVLKIHREFKGKNPVDYVAKPL